jgi:hypothetical protein
VFRLDFFFKVLNVRPSSEYRQRGRVTQDELGRTDKRAAVLGETAGGFGTGDTSDMAVQFKRILRI